MRTRNLKLSYPPNLSPSDLILALVTWRISSILVREDAPFELAAKLRDEVGVIYDPHGNPTGTNPISELFTCIWCMSVWVGLVLAKGDFLKALAYSAAAIWIDRVLHEQPQI